jgi:glycine/D-amino acid oxidase-like deaminating enzyme
MTRDFLIIGGGIAGISASARLSHLGSVTLVEAEDSLAHHASGRSAALYEPYYGLPPVVEFSHLSGTYLREANGGVLSPRGMMIVAGADERALFDKELKGFDLAEISFDEARAHMPILNPATVRYAGWADHAWDIDTDLLIQNFQREARANGGEVLTKSRIGAIRRTGEGWTVELADRQVTARVLINAAGAWVGEVAAMAGVAGPRFTPMRRSMARIPAPGGHDVTRWPMVFGPGESWYSKPDAGALIVSPAEEHPMDPHDAWADDMVLAEGLARYEERVTEPVTRLLTSWAGLRTFSPDRVPVIGFDPEAAGFFWLAGQGGYGFQSAPAISRYVADLIAGRAPDVSAATVAAVSPARFARMG